MMKDNNKLFFSQANSLLLKQLCSHTDKEKEQDTVAGGKGRTPVFCIAGVCWFTETNLININLFYTI